MANESEWPWNETNVALQIREHENRRHEVLRDILRERSDQGDSNLVRTNKNNALIFASKSKRADCITVLLDHEADISTVDERGWSCLHIASYNGSAKVLTRILEWSTRLVEPGSVVDMVTSDGKEDTALMIASNSNHVECVKSLLDHGAHVAMRNKDGRSCLHYAASSGQDQVLEAILDHPDVEVRREAREVVDEGDTGMRTALMLASEQGHLECVIQLLLHGADITLIDEYKWSCLHFAASAGFADVLNRLLDSQRGVVNFKTREGQSALMLATEGCHRECVSTLLRRGENIDVDMRNEDGWSCIHIASDNGDVGVLTEIVEWLTTTRPDPGVTEMMVTPDPGVTKMVDMVTIDSKGDTPLILASRKDNLDCVIILLDRRYRADVDKKNKDGHSCLHVAAYNGSKNVMREFINSGMFPDVTTDTEEKLTPLMLASIAGHRECVRILLHGKANRRLESKRGPWPGWNCLHFAASNNRANVLAEILSAVNVSNEQNLVRMVDSKTRGGVGVTALMIASFKGHVNSAKTLLENSANELLCNSKGFNYVHIAAEVGHYAFLSALLEDGDDDYCTPWPDLRFRFGRLGNKIERLHPESLELAGRRKQLLTTKSLFEQLTPTHVAAIGHHTDVVNLLGRVYRTLALKHQAFVVDPVTMLLYTWAWDDKVEGSNVAAPFDDYPWDPTPELTIFFTGKRVDLWKSIKSMLPTRRSEGELLSNELRNAWTSSDRFTDDTLDKVLEDNILFDSGISSNNLFDLSNLVSAYMEIIQFMNAEDCVGRTALHYLAASCDCQSPESTENCMRMFRDFLHNPTVDVSAADSHGYTPLHLAVKFGKLAVVKAIVDLEYCCDPPEKNLRFSARANCISDPNNLLKSRVTSHRYDPTDEKILKFLWEEERTGVIPLHYAVEQNVCYDGVVKLLVEANRTDLLVATACGASAFSIALMKGPGTLLYNLGGRESKLSRENLLFRNSGPLGLIRPIQDKDHSLFEALERAALDYQDEDRVAFNRIWFELIWSMREVLQQSSISRERIEEYLKRLDEEGDYGGLTILHYAAFRGLHKELEKLLQITRFKTLVNRPFAANKQVALHFAVIMMHEDVVRILTDDKLELLNAHEEDSSHRTPYELVMTMMNNSSSSPGKQGHEEFLKNSMKVKNMETLLRKRADVKEYLEKQLRDREIHVHAGNTALVGATLIASVTFGGWLHPPLGYTEYNDHKIPGTESPASFAAVEQYEGVLVFYVFNCLSFFFAVATVVCGARAVLPARPNTFIAREVRIIRKWLAGTIVLLVLSVLSVLGAFGAAGFVALPPIWKYKRSMVITTSIGGSTCAIVVLLYFKNFLNSRGNGWSIANRIPRRSLRGMSATQSAEPRLDRGQMHLFSLKKPGILCD